MDDASARQIIGSRIVDRRTAIQRWVRRCRRRSTGLAVTGLVAGAIGAAATAGPGLGGQSFTDGVGAGLNLSHYSAVWRVLCLAAMIVSVVASVTAGLQLRFDPSARLGAAEMAVVELDTVRTLMEVDRIPVAAALHRVHRVLATVPFVDDPGVDPLPLPLAAAPGLPVAPTAAATDRPTSRLFDPPDGAGPSYGDASGSFRPRPGPPPPPDSGTPRR